MEKIGEKSAALADPTEAAKENIAKEVGTASSTAKL